MTVTVRHVRAQDKPEYLRMFRDYITFYEESIPEPVIETTWQRLSGGDETMCGLIAIDDETSKPVGIAALVFHRSTWSPTLYCYLEDLYVDPHVRGSGAGRALIEAAYAEADKRGASRTYWATQEKNATARRLYDRIGVLTEFVQYRR